MTLAELVARLGLAEVARRIGATPRTIRNWLRSGVPDGSPLRPKLNALARRIIADEKRKHKRFTDKVPHPPSSELPPEQVKPQLPPTKAVEESEGLLGSGVADLSTDRYHGETHTFNIDSAVLLVDADEIAAKVVRLWKRRKLTFCRVFFLFVRYIPFNPLYKGELVKLQGQWVNRWASTEAWSTEDPIRKSVSRVIRVAQGEAQRRVIWFYQYQVHLFTENATRSH